MASEIRVNNIKALTGLGTVTISSDGINVGGAITATSFVGNVTGDITIGAGTTSAPSLSPSGDSNTGVFFPSADTIAFAKGGSESARFDSSGRLLLGTNTNRQDFFNFSSAYGARVLSELAGNSDGLRISYAAVRNSDSVDSGFLVFGKSRGTTVGSATTVQDGDALGEISFQGADGSELVEGASIKVEVDGTPGANDMPSRMLFQTTADGASSPTERMRITQKGSLLVSSTGTYLSSTASYHYLAHNTASDNVVYVRHLASSGTAHGMVLQLENGANDTTSYHLRNYVAGTLRSAFYSNGGLANVSANNANLSDRNAKKDIAPAAGTWDCLKEWEIVNYRYKDQPDDADLNLGVIAQQVAESCPEVITVFEEAKQAKAAVLDDDGNEVEPAQEAQPEKLGVKEQQMMWMAIKALQQAQTRIETLETANASLEAQNSDILARLDAAGI